jgi:hypothetical protein
VGDQLSKAGLELGNSVADKISEMLERYHQRFSLKNPRLIERYAKAELQLLASFNLGGAREFIAYFQAVDGGFGCVKKNIGEFEICGPIREGFQRHLPEEGRDMQILVDGGVDRDQQTMLVDTVKAVKDGEIRTIPSIVWFDTVDRVYSILPQALYFSNRVGFVLRGGTVGRKLDARGHGCAEIVNEKQLRNEMVKGTPEILNNIPGDGGNFVGNGISLRQIKLYLAGLHVLFFNDSVGIGAKGVDSHCEISEVLFGPLDFYLNERKPLFGGHD